MDCIHTAGQQNNIQRRQYHFKWELKRRSEKKKKKATQNKIDGRQVSCFSSNSLVFQNTKFQFEFTFIYRQWNMCYVLCVVCIPISFPPSIRFRSSIFDCSFFILFSFFFFFFLRHCFCFGRMSNIEKC